MRMQLLPRWYGLALLATLVPAAGVLRAQSTTPPTEAVEEFRHLLATRYVTPLDSGALVRADGLGNLLALVRTDPFTDAFSPAEWQRFTVGLGESFGGIGAVLRSLRDSLVLGDVLPNSPAAAAGLRPRDRLVTIDDSATTGWPIPRAVGHIRGPIGTSVTLGVVRGTAPVRPVRVMRDQVQVPSVPAASISDNGQGFVTVSQFGPGLTADLAETIDRLRAHGMRSLILDLRGNSGGLLDEAIGVANLFLPEGSLVVETRYRGQAPERHVADRPSRYPTMPLAILVGPNSASATEILAGALQDTHRAVIVGRQTYGKGLVQSTSPLGQGWMAKFTVGQWFTPAGRLIDRGIHASLDSTQPFDPMAPHRGGILPDVAVEDSVENAANQAIERMGKAAPDLFVALDDAVGAFLTSHRVLAPETDPLPGGAALVYSKLGADAAPLDSATRAALTPWLDAQVTQRSVEARYGSGTATIWQYGRDPQVRAAVDALGARASR